MSVDLKREFDKKGDEVEPLKDDSTQKAIGSTMWIIKPEGPKKNVGMDDETKGEIKRQDQKRKTDITVSSKQSKTGGAS